MRGVVESSFLVMDFLLTLERFWTCFGKDKRQEVNQQMQYKSDAQQTTLKNDKHVNEGLAVVAGGAGKDPRGEVGER